MIVRFVGGELDGVVSFTDKKLKDYQVINYEFVRRDGFEIVKCRYSIQPRERGESGRTAIPDRVNTILTPGCQAELDAAHAELTAQLAADERKFAGFKRGPDDKVKLPSGDYDERAVMDGTHYECYHCGEQWRDDGEHGRTRRAIDASSHYKPTRPNALPGHIGFSVPAWINTRIRWGKIMLEYLRAKQAYDKFANLTPLQEWTQKRAGMTWNEKDARAVVNILTGSEKFTGTIPDEAARVFSVDCQQGDVQMRTGKFWWIARAVDRFGNLFQLDRGYAESWTEIVATQKRLKIPNENTAYDGGNYLQEILDAAAANFEVVEKDILHPHTGKPTGRKMKVRSVWKILRGNGTKKSFPHGAQKLRHYRSFSAPSYYTRKIEVAAGQTAILNIPVYEWSNLSVKDHLNGLIMGGPQMVKFVALDRANLSPATQEKETGDCAYEKQMQNEYRTREHGRDTWVQATPNVHYRDCECQSLVLLDMGGFLGLPAAPEEE